MDLNAPPGPTRPPSKKCIFGDPLFPGGPTTSLPSVCCLCFWIWAFLEFKPGGGKSRPETLAPMRFFQTFKKGSPFKASCLVSVKYENVSLVRPDLDGNNVPLFSYVQDPLIGLLPLSSVSFETGPRRHISESSRGTKQKVNWFFVHLYVGAQSAREWNWFFASSSSS